MSITSQDKEPKLTVISPTAGKAYMAAAHRICLRDYPLIVPLFINGITPVEMMEFELPILRRSMLARKAGRYNKPDGQLATVSQTAEKYRAELISKTLKDYAEICKGVESKAIELLFPSAEQKTRYLKRANIEGQAQAFLQCLMQLYPSEEIKLQMSLNEDLSRATEMIDLIAWTVAFEKFCVSNAGSKFFNVREAEAAIKDTKMRGYDTPNYIKHFKQAAEDARTCGSTQPEEDVVAQFFLNLNQSSDAFYRYEYKMMDPNDVVFSLISRPLQFALDHAMQFHKTTILTALARKRTSDQHKNDQTRTITSISDIEKLVKGDGVKPTNINVPHAILASLLQSAERKKKAINEESLQESEDEDRPTKKPKGEEPVEDKKAKDKKVRKCYRFGSNGGCRFGDTCRYLHTA